MIGGYPGIERAAPFSWTLKGPNCWRVAAMMQALGWDVEFIQLGGDFDLEIRGDQEEPEHVALGFYKKAINVLDKYDEEMKYYERYYDQA